MGQQNISAGDTAYLTITYILVSGYKNIFNLKMFEHLFCILLQILMNAGIRVHVLQVTDVLIRKVHMSAHRQSQVILSGKFLAKNLQVNFKH